MKHSILLLFSVIFLGCTTPSRIKEDPLKVQEASRRTFETSKDIVWRSIISALNDRSFTIHSTDKSSGIIKATRTLLNKNADTQRVLLGVSQDQGTTIFNALVEEMKPNVTEVKINISGQISGTEVGAFGIENKRVKGVEGIMTVDVLNKWFALISSEVDKRK